MTLIRRLFERLLGRRSSDRVEEDLPEADGGIAADSADGVDSSVFPAPDTTRAGVYVETGTTAEAHFLQLLEEEGGELAQTEFVRLTGWSASTVSRILTELEAEEEVVRVTIGVKNIVYLPDEAPRRRCSRG